MSADSLNTPAVAQSRSASRQQSHSAACDFDRVLEGAVSRHQDGSSWLDSLCLAAGQGMAVICDDEGAIDVVQSSVTGEAWL